MTPPDARTDRTLVGVGVIGVGVMGREHARLLADEVSGARVAAAFDVDPARADAVASAHGARALADPEALIADAAVDAVVIASADPTHERFVLAALAAGKPVLCEKPLAPDPEGGGRVVAAEVQIGRRLVSVGFMRRFDPGFRALRAQLHDGAIGPALLLHCIHRNVSNTATDSAMLITGSAVHEIDTARWLLDDEFATVTVHAARPSSRARGVHDPMLLVLRTAAGVLVDVEVFTHAGYGYEVRCELVGETGTVRLDSPAPTELRSAPSASRVLDRDWRTRFADAYRVELQDWVDAVAGGTPPPGASAWDGYVATLVADAAVAALASGTTETIDLPARPELYA